jgi:hypothetical protein
MPVFGCPCALLIKHYAMKAYGGVNAKSRFSVVDVAAGYVLDNPGFGVRVPVVARIFTSPCRPDRLWGPPSCLSNG